MHPLIPYTMNVSGRLLQLDKPKVMGILNLSEESFYATISAPTREKVFSRVEKILAEGTDMIDVGACSTRPGYAGVTQEEEMHALRMALPIVRELAPDVVLSVDTYRADVAAMCVEEYGVDVINDISAGEMDARMFDTVARLRVPYIMMHMQGRPDTMQDNPRYVDVVDEVLAYLARRGNELRDRGVADVIADPGFGFGKTLEHNYQLMSRLEELHTLGMPLLVGISRKSMIYRLLDTTPDEALNGTTALNTVALMKGAHILRVHDVKACRECMQIVETVRGNDLHD
ncbi:MAG: dihydropteroate synthase [Bacteroidaceae bacterium]|nr:dihydropteroate synthase [Bacteroidaceae bacterium]